jgi:hypothetical protein
MGGAAKFAVLLAVKKDRNARPPEDGLDPNPY